MSAPHSSPAPSTYKDAPTRSVSVDGVDFVHRQLGPEGAVPLVLLHHLAAVPDNWDPRARNALQRGESDSSVIIYEDTFRRGCEQER
ncbi:hypothetical protein OG705_18835 [Streptomyces sp. NBC_00838]|uniref:hypothetical protein n=1 Tax=Streptomyces sp. NBC_00838 TaxID=2903680 RepID=UPI0038635BAD|nr:hypothetical protein OG705_18835 [Streptomyces sp. NBC_00838]